MKSFSRFFIVASVFLLVSLSSAQLPYTLPTPGNVATIGTNTASNLASIFPATSGNSFFGSVFTSAYGSGVFVRDYSAHGAYVLASMGGHAAPFQLTGAVLFDFEAAWQRKRTEPLGPPPKDAGSSAGIR